MTFKDLIQSSNYKWVWWTTTLVGSLLPVILRLMVSGAFSISPYDVKDFLFAGLAMNLANFNLIGHKSFEEKERLATLSGLLIFFISALLGIYYSVEGTKTEPSVWLKVCSCAFIMGSMWVSYQANDYVYTLSKSS